MPLCPLQRVVLVSNPSTFVVGGVVIGAISTDVLYHLNRDETTVLKPLVLGGGPKIEKLIRMAQHTLEQRCFFPMFPAPASDAEPGVPVELLQLWHLGMTVTPDVLILPSKLKTFSKALGSCLVVNPGNLCRSNFGGTYAKMAVFPSLRAQLKPGETCGEGQYFGSLACSPCCGG